MLDATELARRLRAAMDSEPKVSSAALAERCGVTPQAVHGWRTTGRVAKGHLPVIAEMTRKPIEFFLEAEPGASRATRAAWLTISASKAVLLCGLLFWSAQQPAEARFNISVNEIHIARRRWRWWLLQLIPPAIGNLFVVSQQ